MVGLIDMAPKSEVVDVQGEPVAVHGISARGIAHLLGRFPELRKLMSGHEVEAKQMMAMGGDAVAGKLAIDAQADLLAAIVRLTLPAGLGPFVEKLTALGGILDAAPSVTAQ